MARSAIIDASFACLGKYGIRKTSLNLIAKEADCSRELPRYHFGSREGLFKKLFEEQIRYWEVALRQIQERQLTGLDALQSLFEAIKAQFTERPEWMRGQLVLFFSVSEPENAFLRERLVAYQKIARLHLERLIEEALPQPYLVGTSALALATMLMDGLRGLSHRWLIDPKSTSPTQQVDQMFLLIARAGAAASVCR